MTTTQTCRQSGRHGSETSAIGAQSLMDLRLHGWWIGTRRPRAGRAREIRSRAAAAPSRGAMQDIDDFERIRVPSSSSGNHPAFFAYFNRTGTPREAGGIPHSRTKQQRCLATARRDGVEEVARVGCVACSAARASRADQRQRIGIAVSSVCGAWGRRPGVAARPSARSDVLRFECTAPSCPLVGDKR